MFQALLQVQSLLLGMGILLAGSGLLATLLGLRATEEGFSDGTIGLVMSAFYIGYVAGTLLIPRLIRRAGHIRTFAALAAISSAAAIMHGLWVDPWVWVVLRLINGVTLLGLYMVIESWLNTRADSHRGQIFGTYMMVGLFAYGAGQFLIGIHGPMEVATFAIVALLFSLGLVPVALTRTSQPPPMETARLPLKDLFRLAPTGLIGALFAGVITGTIYGMSAVYASRVGLSSNEVALFIATVIIGGALLQWPIGRIADGRDRRYIIILTALFSGLFAAGLLVVEQRGLLWLLATTLLFGGFSFSIYSVSVAQTHDRLTTDQVLEGTRGLLMVNGAGSALGPIISGLLMGWLGPPGFPIFTITAAVILIGLVLWRIWVDAPVPVDERGEYVFTTQTSTAGAALDPRGHDDERQPEVHGADEHHVEKAPPIYEPDPGWEQEYGREQGGRFEQTDTEAFDPPRPADKL